MRYHLFHAKNSSFSILKTMGGIVLSFCPTMCYAALTSLLFQNYLKIRQLCSLRQDLFDNEGGPIVRQTSYINKVFEDTQANAKIHITLVM